MIAVDSVMTSPSGKKDGGKLTLRIDRRVPHVSLRIRLEIEPFEFVVRADFGKRQFDDARSRARKSVECVGHDALLSHQN